MHLIALHTHGWLQTGPKFLYLQSSKIYNSLAFILPNTKGSKRIGPHNIDIISLLVGSLLGDAYGERLASGSVRFTFKQSVIHKEYLFWLYEVFRTNGICSNNLPLISKHKNYFAYYFITYSFSNFIWIYKMFYTHNKIKHVPTNISQYLTPLALAVWIMDDGTWKESGVRIATHSFQFREVELLKSVLESKFNLKVTLHTNNTKKVLYIKNESMSNLRSIVLPHFHKSMYYKLGI